jgi:hypothetical protein
LAECLRVHLTPIQIAESDVEVNTLKAIVEKVVSFFYPSYSSSAAWAHLAKREEMSMQGMCEEEVILPDTVIKVSVVEVGSE